MINGLSEKWGPVRVFFVMSTNFGFSYQLPVIQAMGKYPQIKIRITLEPIGSSMELTDPVEREYFKRYFIPLKSARFQKWHYRIGTSNFRTAFFQDTIGVQLPHGVAAGNNRHSIDRAQHHASNIIFYPSQRCKGIISRDKPATWDDNHRIFFSTGAPTLDPLIRKQFSREKTLEELGLPPGRKTILIGSYWSPRSLLRTWRSDLLIRLASAFPDCNIIQTAHEHIWTDPISDIMPNPRKDLPRFDSEKLMAELRRAERLHCNIRVRRASNIGPLMNAADLFIGDYSSSLVEFSLLDRPILFFDNPEIRFYDEAVYRLYCEASYPFKNLEEIEAKVRSVLENPALRKEGQARIANYFVEYPGCSAERITDLILAMGRIGSPRSPRWRKAVELSKQP